MKRYALSILGLVVPSLLIVGCGQQASTTTLGAQGPTTSNGSPGTTSAQPASQTLTIGTVGDIWGESSLEGKRALDLLIARDNAAGGWDIGPDG